MDSKPMEAFVATEASVFMNQPPPHMSRPSSIITKLILGLLWTITHIAISFLNLWSHLIYSLECYLISSGFLRKYQNLHLGRLKYLAIVVDSKEAKSTAKVKQLLCWLSSMGVKYVLLYDIEGVLKKSFEPAVNASRDKNEGEQFAMGASIKDLHCSQREMVIECISGFDGKEGIAKAANLLCSTYFNGDAHEDGKRKPAFTEADMASALKAVGCGGPEPDLVLVYGPARCHLGFPAWRLRYTEIMYMGPLKSMKSGAIMKALYNFSKKHQNYGDFAESCFTSISTASSAFIGFSSESRETNIYSGFRFSFQILLLFSLPRGSLSLFLSASTRAAATAAGALLLLDSPPTSRPSPPHPSPIVPPPASPVLQPSVARRNPSRLFVAGRRPRWFCSAAWSAGNGAPLILVLPNPGGRRSAVAL